MKEHTSVASGLPSPGGNDTVVNETCGKQGRSQRHSWIEMQIGQLDRSSKTGLIKGCGQSRMSYLIPNPLWGGERVGSI